MINLRDAKRLLDPLKRKIFRVIGRAIITSINNAEGTQKAQLTVLANEVLGKVERIQEYGFDTYPKTDAEAVVLFINGNRDHGLIIVAGDRRYRIQDLVEGEVSLYTHEDSGDVRHRIHLKTGQVIDIKGDEINVITTKHTDPDTGVVTTGDVNITTTGGDTNITTVKHTDPDTGVETIGDVNITTEGNVSVSAEGDITAAAEGDITATADGDVTVTAGGTADVTATGKATITGTLVDIDGGGILAGCITGNSICHFTGSAHAHASLTVKATGP